MSRLIPAAPAAPQHPLPLGTAVTWDPSLEIVGDEVVTGGHPWRVLRLNTPAMAHVRAWENNGTVSAGNDSLARTLVNAGMLVPTFVDSISPSDVDVVIPFCGEPDTLRDILEELREFSVTVVDDGSVNGDGVASLVREYGATYVARTNNGGPGAARNDGATHTSRPYLWFLDADVIIGGAREVLRTLSTHFGDPLVAAVAPRMTGVIGEGVRERFEERFGPLDLGSISALVTPRGRVSYVPTASLLVRRSAFGEGFDDSLRTGEDVDFIWRLVAQGWLVRYDAHVISRHRVRHSTSKWLTQRVHYGEAAAALAERHPEYLAPLRADAWTLLAWTFVLLRRPALSGSVVQMAQQGLADKLPAELQDREEVAQRIAALGIVRAGGPIARAALRTYAPLLIIGLFHRRTRSLSAVVIAGGLWHRLKGSAPHATDIPLALADDLAYSTGVWRGAWRRKSLVAVTPKITFSTPSLKALFKR